MATTLVRIQHRRNTAAQWQSSNETLLAGEVGLETDTGKEKIGTGATAWNSLAYRAGTLTGDAFGDVFNPRSYGAKGDGVTDDSAAFTAMRDAVLATRRTDDGSSTPPVTAQIVIPAGRYLLTQNDALMSYGPNPTAVGFGGLTIRGAGRGATTLVWNPTVTSTTDPKVGNLFSAYKRTRWLTVSDLMIEVANPAANVFYFFDEGTGAQNEGCSFERLHIRGNANRVFGFDGSATANLNSEMTLRNVSSSGAYTDAFFRVGGISGTFNQQNQFLNYWIEDTAHVLNGGTLYRFDKGGSARFTGGSWSAGASTDPAMTFISMPTSNFNNTSATMYAFDSIRFEPKAANHVVIDYRMGQGNVTFTNCSDVASLAGVTGAAAYNLHRYTGGVPWGVGVGPTVRYTDCALIGFHSYDGAGAAQVRGGFIYDGCYLHRNGDASTANTTTGASSFLQAATGRATVAFTRGWNSRDTSIGRGSYDRTRNVYNWKPSNTRRLRRSLARASAGILASHVFIGDSETDNYTGGSTADQLFMWPLRYRDVIEKLGIPIAGTGFVRAAGFNTYGVDPRWTGNFTNNNVYRSSSAAGQTLTFTADRPGTVLELWHFQNSAPYTYSIDGAAPVTVTPPGGSAIPATVTVTGLTDATHTVTLTSTAAATYILGANLRRTTGLLINNIAAFGATAAGTTTAAWAPTTGIGVYPSWVPPAQTSPTPGVFYIALGVNDLNTGTPAAAATAAAVQTLAQRFTGYADVVLIAQYQPSFASTAVWDDYVAALYDVADAIDVPLIDLYDRSGGYTTANSNAFMGDSVHPNRTAQADWGRAAALLASS